MSQHFGKNTASVCMHLWQHTLHVSTIRNALFRDSWLLSGHSQPALTPASICKPVHCSCLFAFDDLLQWSQCGQDIYLPICFFFVWLMMPEFCWSWKHLHGFAANTAFGILGDFKTNSHFFPPPLPVLPVPVSFFSLLHRPHSTHHRAARKYSKALCSLWEIFSGILQSPR